MILDSFAITHYALSEVALTNLYTKACCAPFDPRQAIPRISGVTIPDEATRKLNAQLIAEESLETLRALGYNLVPLVGSPEDPFEKKNGYRLERREQDQIVHKPLEVIDGCCDTIYVATGCMLAYGAPDLPHLSEVCRANRSKFPNNQPILDENGKYQKPQGWLPPDHVRSIVMGTPLCYDDIQEQLLAVAETQSRRKKGK